MSPVVFPVTFEELDATIDFRELAEEQCEGNGYHVAAFRVQHPGGALGYRFTDGNGSAGPKRSLVYISDNEIGRVPKYDTPLSWRDELVAFLRGAHTLVHDTMYTREEYDHHRGWGHSTHEDAVALALDAGVRRLVLFHHKPERTDEEVDRRVEECRAIVARSCGTLEILAAAEGLTLTV